MNGNRFRITQLYNDVLKKNDIILYGAGDIAHSLIGELKRLNCRPLYCIVSDKEQNIDNIDGICVYSFLDKHHEIVNNNIPILIAVSEIYESEIMNFLTSKKMKNIICLSSYIRPVVSKSTFTSVFQNRNFTWYVSLIKEWYLDQNGLELNRAFFQNRITDSKKIALVVESLTPRVIKIANALAGSECKVILFINADIMESKNNSITMLEKKENLDFHYYNLIEELFYWILYEKCEVIHVFSNMFSLYIAHILVENQIHIGKVIFENYDIATGFYSNTVINEEEKTIEQYCLKNASGVCYREFSLEYLINQLHVEVSEKRIKFYDFCYKKNFVYFEKDKKDNEELSICYAGGVVTESEYKDCPFNNWLEMAEICEKNKCHMHIYPNIWDKERYERYLIKDKESSFFHFHKPLPYKQLAKELAQYDYGFLPVRNNVFDNENCGYNSREKYIYSGTNKYFDYLDAGLPIIAAIPQKFVHYLENMGVLLNWTCKQYDFEYLRKMKSLFKERVIKAREQLAVENNIHRLLDFYDSI